MAWAFTLAAIGYASAETRSLKLHFMHTGEKATITFKKNGRYQRNGLNKLNRFLRDWRRNEPTKMDPALFDLVWEIYRKSGSRAYIRVVSAYRSPKTNAMLKRTRGGQATKSQHMVGRALDFYLPDVKVSKLRSIAMKMQGGGVGYYPRSGSPFVHVDTGNVRAWPRMSRKQLVRLFPNGKTLHLPPDGKRLPGYNQALAAYKSRKNRKSPTVAGGGEVRVASNSGAAASSREGRGFLAGLFNNGDRDGGAAPARAPVPKPAPKAPSRAVPAPAAPPVQVASAPAVVEEPVETPETLLAALPAREIPFPQAAPRAPEPVQVAAVTQPVEPVEAVVAEESLPENDTAGEQVALADVPLPSRRPDFGGAPNTLERQASVLASAPADASDASVVASVLPRESSESRAAVAFAALTRAELPAATPLSADDVLRSGRFDDTKAPVSVASSSVPLPRTRPVAVQTDDKFIVAALPSTRPSAKLSRQVEVPSPSARPSKNSGSTVKSARLTTDAEGNGVRTSSLRDLMLKEGKSPRALRLQAKSTSKSTRPKRKGAGTMPRPVVVPIAPDEARWAFNREVVSRTGLSPVVTKALRQPPTLVYTSGFSADVSPDKARQFSGKAVTFLALAKFQQTN